MVRGSKKFMRLRNAFVAAVLLFFVAAVCVPALADVPANSGIVANFLPDRVEKSRADAPIRPLVTDYDTMGWVINSSIRDAAGRTYARNNARFDVRVFVTESESAAYALLTGFRDGAQREHGPATGTFGGYFIADQLFLAKGKLVVHIIPLRHAQNDTALTEFGKLFLESLPRAEDEIPVLVKHLPKWEAEPREVSYFVRLETLKDSISAPVLDSLKFEGSEAVITKYGEAQFLLIEFPTPQLATENDQQIVAKLGQLKTQGQSLPTLYRRVGNYGVFVFGGDEASAKTLADEVRYEQVTKWLGENPYPLLEAQRRYTATTLGVLVSVVKASGLALVVCLSAGGLFGGLLFLRRRSQQRTVQAYSDAGGMLRLNLDEMTPRTDPARLLGK